MTSLTGRGAAWREQTGCASLGFDYDKLVAAKDRLFSRMHNLDEDTIALHAPGDMSRRFPLIQLTPRQNWLFAPELRWQSRGHYRI
jgi:hypothetical protein